MKRIKIFCLFLIVTCILVSTMGVSAEVFFTVDCGNNKVNKGEKLACDMMMLWMNESFTSVSFDYETDFDVTFIKEANTTINSTNGKADITLQNFPQSTFDPIRIATMILDNDDVIESTATVNLSNIKFINSSEEEIDVSDISKTITINQDYVMDSVCELTSITIDGAPLQGFDSKKLEYDNIYINKNSVFLDATRKSDKSSVTGVGSVLIPENETITRVIKVVAENGDTKEYKLMITNKKMSLDTLPDEEDVDNSLKSLELYYDNNKIDFTFDKGKTIYAVAVTDKNITSLSVRAELNNSSSTFVNGYGPRNVNIDYGDNVIEVKVRSASGDVRTYSINVSKDDARSSDNSLSVLKINNIEVPIVTTKFQYDITLPHSVEETDIVAESNDVFANIEFSNITLHDGENEPIILKVISENGREREYVLNIYRLSEEQSNIVFNNIIIDGYSFGFDKNTFEYDLYIDSSLSTLSISLDPSSIMANIIGNENLENGSTVIVQINDVEGTKNYTFNIHKAIASQEKESAVLPIIVLVFGFLSLGASIFYYIKVSKKN